MRRPRRRSAATLCNATSTVGIMPHPFRRLLEARYERQERQEANTMPAIMTKKHVLTQKVTVDYPKQNDRISSLCYTVRLSAPQGAQKAEICIDQDDWLPCREAIGYWWYDWSGYSDGE